MSADLDLVELKRLLSAFIEQGVWSLNLPGTFALIRRVEAAKAKLKLATEALLDISAGYALSHDSKFCRAIAAEALAKITEQANG